MKYRISFETDDISEIMELSSKLSESPTIDEKDDATPSTKKEKKAVKTDSGKPKKQRKLDPDPEDDDDDIFDGDDNEKEETELTADDVRKALKAYAKEHSKEKAMKKIKKYTKSGKIADLDEDDYASLVSDLT